MDKKTVGALGENAACEHLEKNNYRIIRRNFSSKCGEIDIIAGKDDFLVFVEVKTRKSSAFAEAGEYVDAKKQSRIINTANYYLMTNKTRLQPRFDVIEVYYSDTGVTRINHIENAFE